MATIYLILAGATGDDAGRENMEALVVERAFATEAAARGALRQLCLEAYDDDAEHYEPDSFRGLGGKDRAEIETLDGPALEAFAGEHHPDKPSITEIEVEE